MHLLENQLITAELIAELRRAQSLDLAHLPREIALIEGFRQAFPGIPQIACFDTAFHRDLPRFAQLLPIPRHYQNAGVRRLGFHGLSYTYLMSRLAELAGPAAAGGRVILAHLGSGTSMAAVCGGKPIDTTMAFTPTSGLVMGTRPGVSDPGLFALPDESRKALGRGNGRIYLSAVRIAGGLGTSSDMRIFCRPSHRHPRRRRPRVVLLPGQENTFVAGFDSRRPGHGRLRWRHRRTRTEIREGICAGLEFLGMKLDPSLNRDGCGVISAGESRVVVRIIATDEEIVIARIVRSQ